MMDRQVIGMALMSIGFLLITVIIGYHGVRGFVQAVPILIPMLAEMPIEFWLFGVAAIFILSGRQLLGHNVFTRDEPDEKPLSHGGNGE